MTPSVHIIFRLDASVAIGSGHLMRCLALADVLREQGAASTFVMRCDIEALQAQILAHGHYYMLLPEGDSADWAEDAQQTMACLTGLPVVDWLVVDHYRLDARWEQLLRPHVRRLMVVDDMADRPHDCDLLLDQNLHLGLESRYQNLLPPHCRALLGPRFAILRPEFQAARAALRRRDGTVRRVAVFFGGTDPAGATLRTISALAALTPLQHVQWDVIVGAANPQCAQVEQFCAERANLHFHCQITNMAQIMAAADLCIGAGGTALWERAVLGVPSIVIAIAENQVSASVAMARDGALLYLGTDEQAQDHVLQQAILFACANPWLLLSLSARGMEMVDSHGAQRIAVALLGKDGQHNAIT